MNKNLFYKLLIVVTALLSAAMGVLAVYIFKEFNNSLNFRWDLLLGGIASIIAVIALVGLSFYFMIKVIGGKDNGKNR